MRVRGVDILGLEVGWCGFGGWRRNFRTPSGIGLNAPTHRYYPPILPALYPHLKNKTHPLPNHFCSSQNSRHANEGTSLQGRFLPSTQPTPANASSRPTTKRATPAKPHDAGTPLLNACARGVQRYPQHGDAVEVHRRAPLQDPPRTPKHQPTQTDPAIEPRLLQLHP